jgi:ubiquinone/menaquinone biosynthesis C-methylase UbiE
LLRDPENIESNFIRKLLGPSAGDVIEIGCGDGRLTAELLNISDTILALDPDPDSIEKARYLLEKGVKLVLGSGENIPLPDDSVDTVVFSLSLHHHPAPENALAQARRVLKEQGRILVLEPMAGTDLNTLFRIIHDEDDAYDRAITAISQCGLKVAEQGLYSFAWQFGDFEEMLNHLYSHFDLEPEESQVKAMKNTLGSRAKARPLDMEDTTRWWLLTSPSST